MPAVSGTQRVALVSKQLKDESLEVLAKLLLKGLDYQVGLAFDIVRVMILDLMNNALNGFDFWLFKRTDFTDVRVFAGSVGVAKNFILWLIFIILHLNFYLFDFVL